MWMDIHKIINKLIQQHGTSDPFRICKLLDIMIVLHPLGPETRGIIKSYKRSHIICINNDLDELEQLKTCAHELGHYILHRKINTLFMKTCTTLKTDLYEVQADEFADRLIENLFKDI